MIDHQNTSYDFAGILDQFSIEGEITTVKPYGSGHIHDTYHAANRHSEFPDYLLQRINHNIFKNVPSLSENIRVVTAHLRKKLESIPGADPNNQVLTVVPARTEKGYYQDPNGNFWRVYFFIKDARSYDVVTSAAQAYEGGKAFGKFQALLSDLDPNLLQETIPKFHDVENRLILFNEAVARDPRKRFSKLKAEIQFVNSRIESMSTISYLGRTNELPLRITHNDTKFNNVLLNGNDKAQCVIDLDTVMPGYIAYDFGDAIRTIVNSAPEDEKDLTKIRVDMDLFSAFTSGFLEEMGDLMSKREVQSLAHGALLLPFIMGLRFLTDYIDGDNYYKISFPEHNLQRARAQFSLVEKLEAHWIEMQEIIEKSIETRSQTEI